MNKNPLSLSACKYIQWVVYKLHVRWFCTSDFLDLIYFKCKSFTTFHIKFWHTLPLFCWKKSPNDYCIHVEKIRVLNEFSYCLVGVAPSLNFQNWIEPELSVIEPEPSSSFFSDKACEPQPQEIWLSASPIGGTEPKFSKLNRARAYTLRARAELRAQKWCFFGIEPELEPSRALIRATPTAVDLFLFNL